MAKKQTKADGAKAAVVDAEEAPSVETIADPKEVAVYMVKLSGPGDDHKIVRTKRSGTMDFYRRGAAQRMKLTAAEAADLQRKGFDVAAKPAPPKAED